MVDFNVDTLAFNDAGANCTFRNGNGINPADFAYQTLPVLGQNWNTTIATNPNSVTCYIAFAFGPAPSPIPVLNGEVLIRTTPAPVLVSGFGAFSIPIPSGAAWNGFQLSTQGVRLDVVGPTVGIVLLNALDLVLGT